MKLMKQLLPLAGAFGLAGASPTPVFAQAAPPAPAATIHFFQSRAFGLFYPKYRVYADGKLVCKLGRNSHCQVALPAGATAFTAKIPFLTFVTPPVLALTLEAGRDYYLQGDLAPAGIRIPGLSYGFTEVVPNASKLVQISQARVAQPLAPFGAAR